MSKPYHWFDDAGERLEIAEATPGGGAAIETVVTKTADYIAVAGDVVLTDTTGAALQVTLPDPATATATVVVKSIAGTELVTVSPHAGETIDAGATQSISSGQAYTFLSDGTNWWLI